jgi:dihydrolipoamide dehydrogenase
MEKLSVDVAVIGAGTAGLNARREVEKRGGRAVLIESAAYGTTCARVGCMPSKLLIAAAEVAHLLEAAPQFGVHPGRDRRIDGPAVMQRVRRERDRFVGFAVADTEKIDPAQRLRGHARFVGPTRLVVDDRVQVDARAVVVAAGSTPFVPPPFEAIRGRLLTSDDIFELPDLPESLAVIGTGIIALELGQAMHRLGVRTAFFSPFDELGPLTDPEIRKIVRRDLGGELDLRTSVAMQQATAGGAGVTLRWRTTEAEVREETFAHVLVAAGRRPNVAGLGLESTGLALAANGMPAFDAQTTQCGDAPIFLAGDVSGHLPLLHEASDEGRIAGANAMLWPDVERHERRVPLAIAFTDPQMAIVGVRFADHAAGGVAVGAASFDNQGRARVMGRNRGLVRVYGEAGSCRLIGAELFGPGMEHIAHLLAWAVQQRMTVQAALAMPFYHPVLEEGLRTALRDLARALGALGSCRPEDFAKAPGD